MTPRNAPRSRKAAAKSATTAAVVEAPKAATVSLLDRIKAPLFSESHIGECRAKFSVLQDDEFVIVMRKAIEINADPLKGDIYLKTRSDGGYNAIATIACMRSFAQSQGDYAGDDQTISIVSIDDALYSTKVGSGVSLIVVDPARVDNLTNPAGIVSCSMGVYRYIKGEFRRHAHTVTWDDYVPVYSGRISGEAWRNIPFVMIQKVAEAGALRKAYSELGSIYIEEEMDQAGRQDRADQGEGRFSNAPVTQEAREPKRQAAAPASSTAPRETAPINHGLEISVNFLSDCLVAVKPEDFFARVGNFLQTHLDNGHPQKVIEWFEKNLIARQDFYRADAVNGYKNSVRLKGFYEIAQRRMEAKTKARGRRAAQAA